jgi:hypothetical protein
VAADDLQAMQSKLAATPNDAELRRRVAEALDAAGKRDEAGAVLAAFVNLTGHDDDTQLPCLCKRCLPVAGANAEAAGMTFERSFAVHGTRVLHFWMLAEQRGERTQLRASVAEAIAARQQALKEKLPPPRAARDDDDYDDDGDDE